MVTGQLAIKLPLPECCGRGNSIFVPFLRPVLLDVRDAFTGIKEESGGVYGDFVSYAVVFGEDEPSHIDGSNHLFVIVLIRLIYLLI